MNTVIIKRTVMITEMHLIRIIIRIVLIIIMMITMILLAITDVIKI